MTQPYQATGAVSPSSEAFVSACVSEGETPHTPNTHPTRKIDTHSKTHTRRHRWRWRSYRRWSCCKSSSTASTLPSKTHPASSGPCHGVRVCVCVYLVCILCVSCVYASSLPPPTPPPHTPSHPHTHPRRLSVVRWGFEGLAINEMRGLALKCDLPPLRKVVLPTHVIPLTKSPDQESLADQSQLADQPYDSCAKD